MDDNQKVSCTPLFLSPNLSGRTKEVEKATQITPLIISVISPINNAIIVEKTTRTNKIYLLIFHTFFTLTPLKFIVYFIQVIHLF